MPSDEELKAQAEAAAAAKAEADALKAKKDAEEAEAARAALKNSTDDDDDGGKSKINDEAAKLLKEVMKLKEKLKAEADARKAAESKAATFEGLDIEAAKAALKAREEAEEKELERKGEYERLLAKQKEKMDALLEAADIRAKEAMDKLSSTLKTVDELSLGNAFATSRFIQEKLALTPNKTRALYQTHFDIEDGKIVPYDKPRGSSERTKLINASGDPLSFEEAIAEIINADPDKDYLVKAESKAGAGSKTGHTQHEINKTPADPISKIAEGLKSAANFGPANLK